MMDRDPLGYVDALDWWQQLRWSARETCECARDTLWASAEAIVRDIPAQQLFRETSSARLKIEQELSRKIEEVEGALLANLGAALVPASGAVALTDFTGWTLWDVGRVVVAGGSTGALTLGSRAVPGLLAMAGLGAASAVVAPVALAIGTAGLIWSASSVGAKKRQAYVDAIKGGVQRALLSESAPEASVLSRHHARLDAILKARLGELP